MLHESTTVGTMPKEAHTTVSSCLLSLADNLPSGTLRQAEEPSTECSSEDSHQYQTTSPVISPTAGHRLTSPAPHSSGADPAYKSDRVTGSWATPKRALSKMFYRIYLCTSRIFWTRKWAQKIDLDLYSGEHETYLPNHKKMPKFTATSQVTELSK